MIGYGLAAIPLWLIALVIVGLVLVRRRRRSSPPRGADRRDDHPGS